jgi:hypothetical protein
MNYWENNHETMRGRKKKEKEGIDVEKNKERDRKKRRYTTNVSCSVRTRGIQFWTVTGIISIGYVLWHVSAIV